MPQAAEEIFSIGRKYSVWIFKGRLGAGKTTLIKSLLETIDVEDTINSPSYTIINEYVTKKGESIYHLDCFRLNDAAEALDIGIEEYLDSGNLCLIEWPEVLESILPERFFEIDIDTPSGEERVFKLKKNG